MVQMRYLLKKHNKDWCYEDASSRRLLAHRALAALRADSLPNPWHIHHDNEAHREPDQASSERRN